MLEVPRKLAYLRRAQRTQWLPRAEVEAIRIAKLRHVLAFAEANVPLYRESFRKAGVRASDVRSLADLARFPLLTREEVVAAYPEGILSRKPRHDDVVFRTSGTSGLFMQIAYDAKANDFLDAVYARALFATGYRPWHSIAYFWWDAHPKPTRLYERLGLMKKTLLPVDPDPEKQLAAIERMRPQAIYHFPSSLLLLARLLERRPVPSLRPRVVIAHGELMTDEQQVEIARAFGCPVFNQYGAQEFNRMGWDCERHAGMHEDADSVCIEIVEETRVVDDGQTGELVVTGLVNELMPLVRYRIGDAGRRLSGVCPCGRGLPRFALTEGRLDDVLVLPDGRRIGPRTLAPKVEELRGFRQYRVEQRAADRVEVSIVKESDAPDEVATSVGRVLRGVLGEGVAIDVRLVDSIALSRRGKLRKIVRRFAA